MRGKMVQSVHMSESYQNSCLVSYLRKKISVFIIICETLLKMIQFTMYNKWKMGGTMQFCNGDQGGPNVCDDCPSQAFGGQTLNAKLVILLIIELSINETQKTINFGDKLQISLEPTTTHFNGSLELWIVVEAKNRIVSMHTRICRLKLVLVGEQVVVASPSVGTKRLQKVFCWVGVFVCVFVGGCQCGFPIQKMHSFIPHIWHCSWAHNIE